MNNFLSKKQLSVTDIIITTFKVLKNNFSIVSKLFFKTIAPVLFIVCVSIPQLSTSTAKIMYNLQNILLSILALLIYVASIHITKESLLQKNFTFSSVMFFSKSKVIKLFLGTLVAVSAVAPVFFICYFISSFSKSLSNTINLFAVIAYIYLSIRFIYFSTAIVLDEKKILDSYKFSWKISANNASTMFNLFVIVFIVSFVFNIFSNQITQSLSIGTFAFTTISILVSFLDYLIKFFTLSAITCCYVNLTYDDSDKTLTTNNMFSNQSSSVEIID